MMDGERRSGAIKWGIERWVDGWGIKEMSRWTDGCIDKRIGEGQKKYVDGGMDDD